MIRTVIADDERAVVQLLKRRLEATGKVTVVGEASDGLACLRLLEETNPDALFLDITMPGLNGLEVAQIAVDSDHPPAIVFVTAYPEHAPRAFELEAVDYIVKPFQTDRILRAVERIERSIQQGPRSFDAVREAVAQLTQEAQPRLRKLAVHDCEARAIRLLDPASVTVIQREGRRVVLRTKDKEFPTYYTLERLEQRLAPEGFFRVNNSAIVNLGYVNWVVPNGDGSYDLFLTDESRTVLTVSRSRAKALLALLKP